MMAILGGSLIGLAASSLLYFSGRVTGVSGIVEGLLSWSPIEGRWRLAFLCGLLVGGLALTAFLPTAFHAPTGRSLLALALAGILVGFGTRMGNGCTSGHGVCGLTRFSQRSFVATATFMGTGFATATLIGLFT
jgi:hypothetical protein